MGNIPADLAERWHTLFASHSSHEERERLLTDVCEHYNQPHRHYHNLKHIRAVLHWIETLYPDSPAELPAAVWFHDVVYDPRASDNEERSADYAQTFLRDFKVNLTETSRLILLTKTHQTESSDRSGCVLLDADLSILGADPMAYDEYARGIRQEYAWVADSDYRTGRRAVLTRFLQRKHIYQTDEMRRTAESRARENLHRERAALEGIDDSEG